MKKLIVIAALFINAAAFGQDSIKYRHIVKMNPLSLLTMKAVVAYEGTLSQDFTGVIEGEYIFRDFNFGGISYYQEGFDVIAEFRYYLSKKKIAPEGLFIGPYGRYSYSYY